MKTEAVNYPMVALTKNPTKVVATPKFNWRVAVLVAYVATSIGLPLLKLISGHPKTWLVALSPIWGMAIICVLAIAWTLILLAYENWEEAWSGN